MVVMGCELGMEEGEREIPRLQNSWVDCPAWRGTWDVREVDTRSGMVHRKGCKENCQGVVDQGSGRLIPVMFLMSCRVIGEFSWVCLRGVGVNFLVRFALLGLGLGTRCGNEDACVHVCTMLVTGRVF